MAPDSSPPKALRIQTDLKRRYQHLLFPQESSPELQSLKSPSEVGAQAETRVFLNWFGSSGHPRLLQLFKRTFCCEAPRMFLRTPRRHLTFPTL